MSLSTKPASGFRDFLPREQRRRQRVFAIIREIYEAHGFEPIETPTMERLSTLLGKYGDEGDQLIFRILHRGDKLAQILASGAPQEDDLAELGLRYDLTVPLARVVAEHRGALPSVFKRYQIAPVWRGDRPQKGRYREFYQCDVDVAGSTSLTVEVEVTSALASVLARLGFDGARFHINHRELLRALIQWAGVPDALEGSALVAIDKLDKVGAEGVAKELGERGVSAQAVEALVSLLDLQTAPLPEGSGFDNEATLARLEALLGDSALGGQAIAELRTILRYAAHTAAAPLLRVDPFLARGLSYYTGAIFEIRSDDFSGSLGGGGRYDGLVGMFSKQSVPACGFSLGLERLLLLMQERGLFEQEPPSVDVLVTQWDDEATPHALALASTLRAAGLRVDVYPDHDKYKKQFKYADERQIPLVALLGKDELEADAVSLKLLSTGEQQRVPRAEVAAAVRRMLEHDALVACAEATTEVLDL